MVSGSEASYSFLGPAGTFTEAALAQVPEAQGKPWRAAHSVGEALNDVVEGRSFAAMIAVENSIDGGVSMTQDALATIPNLRIIGEYITPVSFVLVGQPGVSLSQIQTIHAHPVAYAQCYKWLDQMMPRHVHVPASSNVASAANLDKHECSAAALSPPGITKHYPVEVLAQDLSDNHNAMTRFALVSTTQSIPKATGADKTSLIVELPEDHVGGLQELLEQFSTRGINLSLIESRPIGDAFGRYRFIIDIDGHIHDERVADALLGLHRFSPNVLFLGSYPRADRVPVNANPKYQDEVFRQARQWLDSLLNPK